MLNTYLSRRAALLFAAALSISPVTSHATLFLYEGFDYLEGDQLDGKSPLGEGTPLRTGFTANWTRSSDSQMVPDQIVPGSLEYGSLLTTGNSLLQVSDIVASPDATWSSDTSGNRIAVPAGVVPLTTGSTLWISFLLERNESQGNDFDPATGFRDFASFQLQPSSGSIISIGELEYRNGPGTGIPIAEGSKNLGIFQSAHLVSKAPQVTANSGMTLEVGEVVFMVARITFNSVENAADATNPFEQMDLFVNPALDSTPVSPTATTQVSLQSLSALRIVTGWAPTRFSFDEIRLGSTYADVAPVPEPSTFGLCALGAIAAYSRRRRRS